MGPTPTRSVVRLTAVASVLLLIAAACSTSTGAASGSAVAASPAPAASPAAAASASSGGGRYGGGTDDEYGTRTPAPTASGDAGSAVHEVNVGDSDDGPYLTGKDGMALYVFGNDSANTSACSGGCAATWPPFTIDAGDELKAGAGVKGKLTTFARADGSMQVAYDRSPLYYYAADEAAGDTKGQGIGDVWFIAKP
jgi:predicted lipoprotein with Yx(FWY)xxD motif